MFLYIFRRGRHLCLPDPAVWPLFQRDTKEFIEMAAEGAKTGKHPSCHNHYHNTIAETTVVLLLGQVSLVFWGERVSLYRLPGSIWRGGAN